jgi:hypothetical protein
VLDPSSNPATSSRGGYHPTGYQLATGCRSKALDSCLKADPATRRPRGSRTGTSSGFVAVWRVLSPDLDQWALLGSNQ